MSRANEIGEFIGNRGFTYLGSIDEDPENEDGYVVFLRIDIDRKGNQKPTNHRIGRLEKESRVAFGRVNFVLVSKGSEDVHRSIKSLLMRKFPSIIRNVFSSVDRSAVSVWIEQKSVTALERSQELEDATRTMVELFGLELGQFTNTSAMKLPTATTCLSIIRRKAPITIEALELEIRGRGLELPEVGWLQRNLDVWRRRQWILRKRNGAYLMTLQGLKALGTAKNRRSADVVRSLDVARRSV